MFLLVGAGNDYDLQETQAIIELATEIVGQGWFSGPMIAFAIGHDGGLAMFDYKKSYSLRFTLAGYGDKIKGAEFSNYLAAYTTYYNYGYIGLYGAAIGGQSSSILEGWFDLVDPEIWRLDNSESILWMTRGALDANLKLKKESERGLQGQLDEVFIRNMNKQIGIIGFLEEFNANNELNVDWFD